MLYCWRHCAPPLPHRMPFMFSTHDSWQMHWRATVWRSAHSTTCALRTSTTSIHVYPYVWLHSSSHIFASSSSSFKFIIWAGIVETTNNPAESKGGGVAPVICVDGNKDAQARASEIGEDVRGREWRCFVVEAINEESSESDGDTPIGCCSILLEYTGEVVAALYSRKIGSGEVEREHTIFRIQDKLASDSSPSPPGFWPWVIDSIRESGDCIYWRSLWIARIRVKHSLNSRKAR